MPSVLCERIAPGLRESEVIAAIRDFYGRKHDIRVERDFLHLRGGQSYLPVEIVHIDPASKAVLIELPHEAETGANRLWVSSGNFLDPVGVLV